MQSSPAKDMFAVPGKISIEVFCRMYPQRCPAGQKPCTTSDDSYTDLCVIICMLHAHAGQDLASTLHVELDRLCGGHSVLNQGVGQALGCLAGPNHAQTLFEGVLGAAGAAGCHVSMREHSLSPRNVRRAARQQLYEALPQGLVSSIGAQGPCLREGSPPSLSRLACACHLFTASWCCRGRGPTSHERLYVTT